MTFEQFKRKWARFTGKESSAYQEHFDDLCRVLAEPTPAEADPSGADFFCFQKRVVKDQELFDLETPDTTEPMERGFADVWKKGCFAWEYKGKKKNLEEAYKQLLRYRESLLNPPLLVVCDFDQYIIRTNFNGTVQDVYEFNNDQIDRPDNLRVLRALFSDPDFLKPQKTTAQVTEELASQIAELARSLQKRETIEFEDAKNRKQVTVAQRKNLRIARFLNRIIFCFFAEDSKLLPDGLFTQITKTALDDPKHFATALEELFHVMATGGTFGHHKIRHFNGHLFEEATVFELNDEELAILAAAADADWVFIQPSIMGTLFERALEPEQRSQLGAHYTSEDDIRTLVEPVLMAPLRQEWSALKGELARPYAKGKGTKADRDKLAAFLKKIAAITVLDPACGSGNFLYVSLQLLLGLEKEVIAFATQVGFDFKPAVSVQQLKAIEINPYAYELAQVSVQIGYLQWRRDNGFDNDRTPVLQHLKGFENKDALMHETFRKAPKNLKAARQEEHQKQDELFKVYLERSWPECDVIVGNPPFLGTKKLRTELGDRYVKELFAMYGRRIPNFSDLCCYWFEKARDLIEQGKCRRAGLLATQGIRGGLNREVLKRILSTGGIFFAESDRPWVLAGASVHVSMVAFDDGSDTRKILDGKRVQSINANLTGGFTDITQACRLAENRAFGFIGDVKAGKFDMSEEEAIYLLSRPNPNGLPSSDVLTPYYNSLDILRRPQRKWVIDFESAQEISVAEGYAEAFARVKREVWPLRSQVKRKTYRDNWWLHAEPCSEMRTRIAPLKRFLVTTTVSKHRIFAWLSGPILPDHQLVAFATESDYVFGVLHSRFHQIWALRLGTRLETRPRYTPTTCFETFPMPLTGIPTVTAQKNDPLEPANPAKGWADSAHFYSFKEDPSNYSAHTTFPNDQVSTISYAAQDLNKKRERWLNPPEWTIEETLVFPGTRTGPWFRFLDPHSVDFSSGIGSVKYSRLAPRNPELALELKNRTLTKLYNEMPSWLATAHKKLDDAVAAAYGWPVDLSDEDILARLLKLNLERAAAEKKAPAKTKTKVSREKFAEEII